MLCGRISDSLQANRLPDESLVEMNRRIRPGMKAIFTTGHNSDAERLSLQTIGSMLHKPCDIDELSRARKSLPQGAATSSCLHRDTHHNY